jgi:hypothetical protein
LGFGVLFVLRGLIPKNPPFGGRALGRLKKVLNPEYITSGEQHASPDLRSDFRARLLIDKTRDYPAFSCALFVARV